MFEGFWVGLAVGAIMSLAGPAPTPTIIALMIAAVACLINRAQRT